jgi:hypothetical protein
LNISTSAKKWLSGVKGGFSMSWLLVNFIASRSRCELNRLIDLPRLLELEQGSIRLMNFRLGPRRYGWKLRSVSVTTVGQVCRALIRLKWI